MFSFPSLSPREICSAFQTKDRFVQCWLAHPSKWPFLGLYWWMCAPQGWSWSSFSCLLKQLLNCQITKQIKSQIILRGKGRLKRKIIRERLKRWGTFSIYYHKWEVREYVQMPALTSIWCCLIILQEPKPLFLWTINSLYCATSMIHCQPRQNAYFSPFCLETGYHSEWTFLLLFLLFIHFWMQKSTEVENIGCWANGNLMAHSCVVLSWHASPYNGRETSSNNDTGSS